MAPRTFPAIVGRKEMAEILQVHRNNTFRLEKRDGFPKSLQERYGEDVVAVGLTPLWFRDEIEAWAAGYQADRRTVSTTT